MSCIVGYAHEGGVVLGADAAASTTHLRMLCPPHKLFRAGPALVGVCGGIRLGQIIRYRCPSPKLGVEGPVPSLLGWIEEIRPVLRDAGVLKVKDAVEESDSRLLVALAGHLFEIDAEWQIVEPVTPFWAIGSGQPYALGALDALELMDPLLEVNGRLLMVLETAAKFDPSVRGPFESLTDP